MIVSFAQPESARIQGTVADSTGVVIAGATVKVASTAAGREVTASSGDDPSFSVLSLPPGRYGVEVTAANFKTTEQEITLEATQTAPLPVALEAGAVSETVTVTTGIPWKRATRPNRELPHSSKSGRSSGSLPNAGLSFTVLLRDDRAPEEFECSAGDLTWLRNSDESGVLTFRRKAGADEVVVAINLSSTPFAGTVEVTGDLEEIIPSASGLTALPSLSLDAYGFRIFKRIATSSDR